MIRPLALLVLLSACAEFPVVDARVPAGERTAVPPPLLPLTGLLATAEALPATQTFAPELAAEAARLQAQAAALPAPTTGADAQRLADLQSRAEALRDGVLTDEERARLESGASLP